MHLLSLRHAAQAWAAATIVRTSIALTVLLLLPIARRLIFGLFLLFLLHPLRFFLFFLFEWLCLHVVYVLACACGCLQVEAAASR